MRKHLIIQTNEKSWVFHFVLFFYNLSVGFNGKFIFYIILVFIYFSDMLIVFKDTHWVIVILKKQYKTISDIIRFDGLLSIRISDQIKTKMKKEGINLRNVGFE